MASWQPKKLDLTKINSGARFNNGDGVNADDINAVVESSAFVQSLGENQPQLIEDGGATSVSIDTTNNKFVFKNIKGQKGEQGIQGVQGERGEGVPSGGTVGQVLTKTSSGTAWETPQGGGSSGQWLNPMNIEIWDNWGGMHYGVLVPKGFTRYSFYLGRQSEQGIVHFSTNEMLDRNTQYWNSGRGMTYTPDYYYSASGDPYNNEHFIFFEYNLYGSDTDYTSFSETPYVKMEV